MSSDKLEAYKDVMFNRNSALEFENLDSNEAFDLFFEAFKANADTYLLNDTVIAQDGRDKIWITEDIKSLIWQRESLYQ